MPPPPDRPFQPYRAAPVQALCAKCRQPATIFCPGCGKALCVDHTSFHGICLNCEAAQAATFGRSESFGGLLLIAAGFCVLGGVAPVALGLIGVGLSSGVYGQLRRRRLRRIVAQHLPSLERRDREYGPVDAHAVAAGPRGEPHGRRT